MFLWGSSWKHSSALICLPSSVQEVTVMAWRSDLIDVKTLAMTPDPFFEMSQLESRKHTQDENRIHQQEFPPLPLAAFWFAEVMFCFVVCLGWFFFCTHFSFLISLFLLPYSQPWPLALFHLSSFLSLSANSNEMNFVIGNLTQSPLIHIKPGNKREHAELSPEEC